MCLSDWNQLRKTLKANFKNIERSALKNIIANYLLKKHKT